MTGPSTRSRCPPALPRYGARARLLGMREEFRRGSNASDECQIRVRSEDLFGATCSGRGRYYVQGRRMRRRHFSLEGLFQQPRRGKFCRVRRTHQFAIPCSLPGRIPPSSVWSIPHSSIGIDPQGGSDFEERRQPVPPFTIDHRHSGACWWQPGC